MPAPAESSSLTHTPARLDECQWRSLPTQNDPRHRVPRGALSTDPGGYGAAPKHAIFRANPSRLRGSAGSAVSLDLSCLVLLSMWPRAYTSTSVFAASTRLWCASIPVLRADSSTVAPTAVLTNPPISFRHRKMMRPSERTQANRTRLAGRRLIDEHLFESEGDLYPNPTRPDHRDDCVGGVTTCRRAVRRRS
jgi:hypothetical protein